METSKTDIRNLSEIEIDKIVNELGEKAFRAGQIKEWIWKRGAQNFDAMTNISKSFRDKLQEKYCFFSAEIVNEQHSSDKTVKAVFRLHDSKYIEGVLIPSTDRVTACISTQVGCAMDCKFCATGKMGFIRNLSAGEILDQVFLLNNRSEELFGRVLSNIVVMGMGEPLLNLDALAQAIRIITAPKYMGMSPKRITVSTVGIPKMIKKFADLNLKVHFSVSLHSAIDEVRTPMMPVNKRNNLTDLRNAIKYFHEKTNERITYEYILFDGINNSLKDAGALAEFCKISPCKINIIEYNNTSNDRFKRSRKDKTDAFVEFLEKRNLIVNIRRSRGKDIDAACGQLAGKMQ
jgi:23S rRNA (adenine2503-C2)-methyltransferase